MADRNIEMEFTIELACVEGVIENEITHGCSQRTVAMSYALGLRSSWPTDWKRVNEMIVARWPKGLERVKRMAWKFAERGPDGL